MPSTADHQPPTAATAETERLLAERQRETTARQKVWQAKNQAQEDARRRLAGRYGSDREKRWTADPTMPRADAVDLMHAFLHKARSAVLRSPEMEQAPRLERQDALAAAYMIRAARFDARQREINVMRQCILHGATWDELAHALDTTAKELKDMLRRHGYQPDTWAVSAGGGNSGQSRPVSLSREKNRAALVPLTGESHLLAQQNGGDSHVGHP